MNKNYVGKENKQKQTKDLITVLLRQNRIWLEVGV
jgi:hypothetical protein